MKYFFHFGCWIVFLALPACGSGASSADKEAQPASAPAPSTAGERAATARADNAGESTKQAAVPGEASGTAGGIEPVQAPGAAGGASAKELLDVPELPDALPTMPALSEPGVGSCCSAQATGGCEDSSVQACVCAADPGCCTEAWDELCAALVAGLGCGTCKADCCEASGSPGCTDPEVEQCVCDKSPECCDNPWDEFCVLLVSTEAAGGACGLCK